jgi:hypothetical protein
LRWLDFLEWLRRSSLLVRASSLLAETRLRRTAALLDSEKCRPDHALQRQVARSGVTTTTTKRCA